MYDKYKGKKYKTITPGRKFAGVAKAIVRLLFLYNHVVKLKKGNADKF